MFYEFPHINNIADVLPAIEGSKEFIAADRGDHIVINYVVSTPDTFPPVPTAGGSAKMRAEKTRLKAIRRECRGMIFDRETGNILRRPYHKFFNLNQTEETQIDKIDLSQPHDILEKLDGSMIVPYRVPRDGRVVWGTKMGDTDVATPVHDFVKKNPKYQQFFDCSETNNVSLIFEWMSRVQRIVIDHPEDRLVLTAIRALDTGRYFSYKDMQETAEFFDIPCVERFHVEGNTSIEDIMEYIRAQEGTEGVVIRYGNGHMLKIKSEWYSAIHGAKELITQENNVVRLIINEEIDDAKALVLEEDRQNLDRYERDFWKKLNEFTSELEDELIRNFRAYGSDRKSYALESAANDPDAVRVATFHFMDKPHPSEQELREFVIDRFVRTNVNNRTKFTAMKQKVLHNLRLYL